MLASAGRSPGMQQRVYLRQWPTTDNRDRPSEVPGQALKQRHQPRWRRYQVGPRGKVQQGAVEVKEKRPAIARPWQHIHVCPNLRCENVLGRARFRYPRRIRPGIFPSGIYACRAAQAMT